MVDPTGRKPIEKLTEGDIDRWRYEQGGKKDRAYEEIVRIGVEYNKAIREKYYDSGEFGITWKEKLYRDSLAEYWQDKKEPMPRGDLRVLLHVLLSPSVDWKLAMEYKIDIESYGENPDPFKEILGEKLFEQKEWEWAHQDDSRFRSVPTLEQAQEELQGLFDTMQKQIDKSNQIEKEREEQWRLYGFLSGDKIIGPGVDTYYGGAMCGGKG